MRFRTAYLDPIYGSPAKYKRLIDKIADKIVALKKKTSFSGMAFRGQSGGAIAYPLSAQLKIPLICVRKQGENSHGFPVEGSCRNIRRYIIIDDFMETGKTIKKIIDAINKEEKNRPKCYGPVDTADLVKCVGVVFYTITQEEGYGEFFEHKGQKIPIYYWG